MENLLKFDIEISLYENLKSLIIHHKFEEQLTLTEIDCFGKNYQTYKKYSIEGTVSLNRRNELKNLKESVFNLVEKEGYSSVEIWKVEVGYFLNDKLPELKVLDDNENEFIYKYSDKINKEKVDFSMSNNIDKNDVEINSINKIEKVLNDLDLKDLNQDAAHIINSNGNKSDVKLNIIHVWSMFNKSFDNELTFIELSNILSEISYLNSNFYKNTQFKTDKINQVMICGDNQYDKFIEFVNHKNWKVFLPQLISPNIFEEFCINSSPYLIIADNNGIVLYSGNPYTIKTADTIVKYFDEICKLEESNLLENPTSNNNSICEKYINISPVYNEVIKITSNSWWNETDDETKAELINEVNLSLYDIEVEEVQFTVITQKVFQNNTESKFVIPVFTGIIDCNKEDQLKEFTKDLSETLNFTDIKYDLVKINSITHVNSFEFNQLLQEKKKIGKKETAEKGV